MKLYRFILPFLLCIGGIGSVFGAVAANDLILTQRNAANNNNTPRYITSTANRLIQFDAASPAVPSLSLLAVVPTTGAISGFTTGNGLTFHGGGTLTGASGALTLTASGTNQNITLTPSGTGGVTFGASPATAGLIRIPNAASVQVRNGANNDNLEVFTVDSSNRLTLANSSAMTVRIRAGGQTGWDFNTNGHLVPVSDATFDIGVAGNSGVRAFYNHRTGLGATSTDGIVSANQTAATGGATVQISPRFRLRGNAWDTSASQTVDFFIENLPATAATPTGTLKFGYSLNGAAATYPMTLTSAGTLTVLGDVLAGADVKPAAGGTLNWFTRSRMASPSDGVLLLNNNAATDFGRLQFGGTSSSFPAIKRNAAALNFRLADDSADAAITAAGITASGDIEVSDIGEGVIIKSPNGTRWRLTVSDAGVVGATSL